MVCSELQANIMQLKNISNSAYCCGTKLNLVKNKRGGVVVLYMNKQLTRSSREDRKVADDLRKLYETVLELRKLANG